MTRGDDEAPPHGLAGSASPGHGLSISAILSVPAAQITPRPRLTRFIIAAIAVAGVIAFITAVKQKLWPTLMFPVHLAHDHFYLVLKGWLWSAWYPWCLVLWIPVAVLAALGIWSWVTGVEPTRRLQRRLILAVVDRVPHQLTKEPHRSVLLIARVSKLARSLGLSTSFIQLVTSHAFEERLDELERASLAGVEQDRTTLARAVNLLDARIAVRSVTETAATAGGLAMLFDIAFLMHLDEDLSVLLEARLRRCYSSDGLLPEDAPIAKLLGGAPVEECRETIAEVVGRIDALAQMGSDSRRKSRGGEDQWRVGSIQEAFFLATVGFLKAPDPAWAGVCLTILTALDRMWLSLAIADRHDDLKREASRWVARSRLATIRRLHRNAWPIRPNSLGGNDLWAEEADLYFMLYGADLTAGAS